MMLRGFEYRSCHDVATAVSLLQEHGDEARLIAGGTVVVSLIKHGLLQPSVLVGLEADCGMDTIEPTESGVTIGALATHRVIASSSVVRDRVPLLAAASNKVASPTIRSMGTIGGNLCYGESASDPAPALLVAGATLTALGPQGSRTIDISDFYEGFYTTTLADDEVLTTLEVPALPDDATWTYFKWTPRANEDKPLIGLAVMLAAGTDGEPVARLAVGGVGDRPVMLTAASEVLTGSDLSDAAISRAAEAAATEVEPIEDLQGSPDYRRDMLGVWVRRVVQQLRDRGE